MPNISIDFSFKSPDFFSSFVNFIRFNYKITKVEYSFNFEWFTIKNIDLLTDLKFDQLKINIKTGGRFLLQKDNPNMHPRIYISELDISGINNIIKEIQTQYSEQIINGFICDEMDRALQNDDEIRYWKRKLGIIPSYVEIYANPLYDEGKPGMDMIVKEFINIESLPGHFHLMNYDDMLWFGSCWQMYFSEIYYKYIPKSLFDSFEDCYENVILENGLRKITLYKYIEDFDLPENRIKQWIFRRSLGIDSIAHELTKSNNRIEPVNLSVLITKQNCIIGQTRVIRFLDANNRLISSDKAVKKEIKEYLEDGITMVFEELQII